MKKQDEQRLVPKLRFKGFSEDWEQRKLKDITEMISERNTDNHYQNVFTNSALHGIINQTDYFDRNIANSTNLTSYYVVHKNNFIYNPRISSNAPYGPINRNKLNQVGIMSPLYLVFENRLASHDFLEYYFFSSKWYKYMLKVGNTGARSDRYAVKNKDFFNMPIFIPEYDEQCKIGNILKVLNKTISLHKRKLEVLKVQKNIYLNKMFASKYGVIQLRFKGFTEHWEQRELGEVFKYEQPTKYLVTSTDYSDEYCTPVLTAGQSFILGYTDDTEGIKKASKTNPVVIFDDFTTGNHYVDFPFKIKSSALKILSISDKSYDDYFTFYSLNRIKYSPQNHQRHWISIFSRIKVHMPTISEQVSIGNLLRTIDNMITLHNEKLNKLKSLKQEYLNYLFI